MDWNEVVSRVNVYGIEDSVRASKYPMSVDVSETTDEITSTVTKLAQSRSGSGEDTFLNGIVVQFDLTFTVKAWTEAERYNFLHFVSSQSTMHRIAKLNPDKQCISYVDERVIDILREKIAEHAKQPSKEGYLNILYNVPVGYRLTARMSTNYRQLKTIYAQRRNHRLPEWRAFCEWIETLPHAEFITGAVKND